MGHRSSGRAANLSSALRRGQRHAPKAGKAARLAGDLAYISQKAMRCGSIRFFVPDGMTGRIASAFDIANASSTATSCVY